MASWISQRTTTRTTMAMMRESSGDLDDSMV